MPKSKRKLPKAPATNQTAKESKSNPRTWPEHRGPDGESVAMPPGKEDPRVYREAQGQIDYALESEREDKRRREPANAVVDEFYNMERARQPAEDRKWPKWAAPLALGIVVGLFILWLLSR